MGIIISMVKTEGDNYIFVKGFNSKHEIVFRTSLNPKRVQHEKFEVDSLKGIIYMNAFTIPVVQIQSFVDPESGVLIVNEELDNECNEGHQ